MSSFSPVQRGNNKKGSEVEPMTFKDALNQMQDIDEYDFAPHIQQYNFGSYPTAQNKQVRNSKKSDSVKNSHVFQKQSSIRKNDNSLKKDSFEGQKHSKKLSEIDKNAKKISQIQFKKSKGSDIAQNYRKRVEDLQRQNEELRKDNEQMIKKINQLQRQVIELNRQLTAERTKENDYQMQLHRSLSNKQLEKKSKQNSLLMGSPTSSRQKTLSTSPLLLKQLLLECNESRQFQDLKLSVNKTKSSNNFKDFHLASPKKDQFYEYKNTKDCFEPFFTHLSRQLQLRCKKSMIRQKQLVYKDDLVEVGCISRKIDDHEFQLNIVLTNLINQPIKNINVAYLTSKDIQIAKEVKSTNLEIVKSSKDHTIYSELSSAEQVKETLSILVHTVDFRCILISVQFIDSKGQLHKISQILPGCKHRLFTFMVPTPIPSNYIFRDKVVVYDKKLLPELQKLKSYYKSVHLTSDRHKNPEALLKLEFLSNTFFVTLKQIGSDKLAIGVHHAPDYVQLAQKILGQFNFIFQR